MGKKIIVVKIHCSVLSLSYVLRTGRVKHIKVRKFVGVVAAFFFFSWSAYKTVYTHCKNLETATQKT